MASPRTDSTGQIQKASDAKPNTTLAGLLKELGPEIARAIPRHVTPDRMARVVLTALRTVPDLARCTRESFAGCVMQLSQLGLEPNTPLGHAYLIPRYNSKKQCHECTLIIGYQGFLDLGRRAGVNAFAYVVRQGDEFRYTLGLNPELHHIPSSDAARETKPITHVYAVARTKEFADSPIFVVLSKAQVDARKARSATAGKSFSPWSSDEEAMTLKTGIRALWKWMPKTIEASVAEAVDDAADRGLLQADSFDPTVSDVLINHGLLQTGEAADDSVAAEVVDPETGEVARQGTLEVKS